MADRQQKSILRIEIEGTIIQRKYAADSYIDAFNYLYENKLIDESILNLFSFVRKQKLDFSIGSQRNAAELIKGSNELWITSHSSTATKKYQLEQVFEKYKVAGKVSTIIPSNFLDDIRMESVSPNRDSQDYTNEFADDINTLDVYHENSEPEIEEEVTDVSVQLMDKPFDPTKINIETKTPSLDTLINRIRRKNIQLNTESYFQRKDDLWDVVKQSRLIESILIRFPLPAFFFDATDDNNWLIVDGLQRLSSIRNFAVEKTLRLNNLEFLEHLNGSLWDDLSSDLQRIIEESQVVVYKIMPGTPTDVKFNIFKRINTGGLILTPQEIRHALFQGKPARFVYELSRTPEFLEATNYKIKTHRMLDRDFANRFLCFYLFGYQNYTPDLDTFMSKAMAAINDKTESELSKIRNDFSNAMKLSIAIFGIEVFRKTNPDGRLLPINKALFDAVSVQFSLLDDEERNALKLKTKEFNLGFKSLLHDDETFLKSISSSTGDKKRVHYRHNSIEQLIKSTIR